MTESLPNDPYATFVTQQTEHQLALQWYVRSLLPGDFAASDVVQQANTKIWQKRSEFEPGTNFKAWAFSIARFEVLSYRKRQTRDSRLAFNGELEQLITEELPTSAADLSICRSKPATHLRVRTSHW